MTEERHVESACPKCGSRIDGGDSFCRHCGLRLSEAPWYYNKLFVILMLFLVAGALGLPLLIRSPEFTPREKVVYSIVVTLYTAGVLLLFVLFMMWIWSWGFSQLV